MTLEYQLINDHHEFQEFCLLMENEPVLYIDTEFVGEKYYYPRLELIKIGNGKNHIGLIDPQCIKDATPLKRLLADESKLKVFHSASQDLTILKAFTGVAPRPIFDTQLAAAMVGIGAQVSFANLVKMYTDVEITKQQTVSDWSQRPLSNAQLVYAANDVYYLPVLHNKLQQKLEKLEREQWFLEEQELRLNEAVPDQEPDDSTLFRSVKEWGKLYGINLAVLQALAFWREETARNLNIPKRQIMPDGGLIALARTMPSSTGEARKIRQLPQGPLHRYLDEILSIVKKGLQTPKEDWPKRPAGSRPDIPVGFVELLQALIRAIAEEHTIASSILTTSSELQQLVNNRHDIKEDRYALLQGWRRELAGNSVLALLDGKLMLKVKDRESLVFY